MNFLDSFRSLFRRQQAPNPAEENSKPRINSVKIRSGNGVGGFWDLAKMVGSTGSKSAQFGRLESSWAATPTTADAQIYQEWNTLVGRAQKGFKDYDTFKKFVSLVRNNVIGATGITLIANIKNAAGAPDKLASDAIKDAWYEFSKKGNFEVTRQFSRSKFERNLANSWSVYGEAIVLVKYGKKYPQGIAFQQIDPVRLDPMLYQKLPNGNHIRHGIEMDEDNCPVAYYFKEYDEQQYGYIPTYMGQKYTIVPAANIIHWFTPEQPNQKRGIPPSATPLWQMRMVDGFMDAVAVNARVGAAKMGWFRDPDAEDEDDGDNDFEFDAEPGTFGDIGNRELQSWTPQFPDQAIEPFLRAQNRSIASGLNVSYYDLTSDLTAVNFSSIRQGQLDSRETWKELQQSFIDDIEDPMFQKWLEVQLLRESIKVKGSSLKLERIEKYKAVTFKGRRWAWIDPAAEQSANEKAVAQGFKSRSEVIGDTSNRQPEEVWDEIQAENKALAEREIVPLIPSGSVPPMQTEPASEQVQEDETSGKSKPVNKPATTK